MVRYEERKYHAGLQNGRETPIISSRGSNFVHVQVQHMRQWVPSCVPIERIHVCHRTTKPRILGKELVVAFAVYLSNKPLNKAMNTSSPNSPHAHTRAKHSETRLIDMEHRL